MKDFNESSPLSMEEMGMAMGNHQGHQSANGSEGTSPAAPTSPNPNDGMPMQMSAQMAMPSMFFHFGTEEVVLFRFWNVTSAFGIFVAALLIVVSCFLLEFVRWLRSVHKRNQIMAANMTAIAATITYSNKSANYPRSRKMAYVWDASLHGLQLTLANLLMLIFMTFNVWLCAAAIIGQVLAKLVLSLVLPQPDLDSSSNGIS